MLVGGKAVHFYAVFLLVCAIWNQALGQVLSSNDHLTRSRLFYKRSSDCLADADCKNNACWGYESHCNQQNRLFFPTCSEPARPWAKSMEEKHDLFWRQADFGYVKEVVDSMMEVCRPQHKGDSLLRCSKNERFCVARHLYIDFSRFDEIVHREESAATSGRFKEDIFDVGEIGGKCLFDKELHKQQGEHKSPLQSWFAELESFSSLDFKPNRKQHCDEIIKGPVVFMKLDAGVSLYHHFCDFYNLYASLHANGSFTRDLTIVMWDTSYRHYGELFGDAWKPFTKHPMIRISDFAGKRLCFRDAMFALLPRMRGGLYYNTYIVPGCYSSAMTQAFSEFMLRGLDVEQQWPLNLETVQVTLLARNTSFRNILNQDELVRAMKTVQYLDVQVVVYNYRTMEFVEQLKHTHNSDIFIGMHGAGLTHLLFLPDWAAIFELHNTGDNKCYYDLARQRGIQYQTWEDENKVFPEDEGHHPTIGAHQKFTNYSFDVEEFMRIILRMADNVLERKRQWSLAPPSEPNHDEL